MDRAQVHFELFTRRDRDAPWALTLATENRQAATYAAKAMLAKDKDAAVRLCKETRDAETGEFRQLVLMEHLGKAGPTRARAGRSRLGRPALVATEGGNSVCNQPRDLYTPLARETMGRVLAGWFKRHRVTPFELLHRADMAELLEACDTEVSVALSNVVMAQGEMSDDAFKTRHTSLKKLVKKTVDYVIAGDPDEGFQLGVAVSAALAPKTIYGDKITALLDLLDSAPETGPQAELTMRVLQNPLMDLLTGQAELNEIVGEDGLALGDQLLILLQVSAAREVATRVVGDPALAKTLPRPQGLAARLAISLHRRPVLIRSRRVIARRAAAMLAGEAPLWPGDPARTVEGLKTLATLLPVCGELVDQGAAEEALCARWRTLVKTDFIETRLALCSTALDYLEAILEMMEAAAGRAVKETLGRRLLAVLAKPAVERGVKGGAEPVAVRLRRLAEMVSRVREAAPDADIKAEAERRLRALAASLGADAPSASLQMAASR
jgi:hypothetical protein